MPESLNDIFLFATIFVGSYYRFVLVGDRHVGISGYAFSIARSTGADAGSDSCFLAQRPRRVHLYSAPPAGDAVRGVRAIAGRGSLAARNRGASQLSRLWPTGTARLASLPTLSSSAQESLRRLRLSAGVALEYLPALHNQPGQLHFGWHHRDKFAPRQAFRTCAYRREVGRLAAIGITHIIDRLWCRRGA